MPLTKDFGFVTIGGPEALKTQTRLTAEADTRLTGALSESGLTVEEAEAIAPGALARFSTIWRKTGCGGHALT